MNHWTARGTRRRLAVAMVTAAAVFGAAACSSSTAVTSATSATSMSPSMSTSATPGMGMTATASASATGMPAMGTNGSEPMYVGTGLSASDGGFTFAPEGAAMTAGQALSLHFKINDSLGMAVTSFVPDQTKLMHFYLIRSDLTGFQHVHPTMAADGTWTANLTALAPGSYRAYAAFNAKNASGATVAEVLSTPLIVPGAAATAPPPAPSSTTRVDGYTLTLSGQPMDTMSRMLTVTVSKNGQPVADLQPYLDTYAHLTAIHAGDLAFAHLHPDSAPATAEDGGPTLTFQTAMPESGDWRFFIQFQTAGVLHTAAITVHVG